MSLLRFRTDSSDLSVSLNGTLINIPNTIQLLGVSINKDLNFIHAKETVGKIRPKLRVLKCY